MLSTGSRVGGLLIHELVGRGAMGEVYRAEQVNLQRPVAVKRIAGHLADQPSVVARFEREARLVATLNSPHVVQVYEFGPYTDEDEDRHLLLVMEWIEGGRSLRQCMTDGVGLPWQTVAQIMRQAALGLQVAHEQGIVHRDVKPDNMLLSPRGEVKIADFGLANADDSSALTADGSVIGTPNYLSPEACNGSDITPAGDIYSLGASCFHLLTGCPLYTAPTTIALLRAHCDKPVPQITAYVGDVPDEFAALITACLQKDVKERIDTAKEIVETIERMQQDGLGIETDLGQLVALADNNREPSTLPTQVDAHAATNVSKNVQQMLGSNVRSASTTAETLIADNVTKTEPVTRPTEAQTADTTPAAKSRIGVLVPLIIIGICLGGILAWLLFHADPVADAAEDISQHVDNGDLEVAFSLADKLLEEYTGNKDIHEALRGIIDSEISDLIKNQQFDQAVERLDEHRERYHWLKIDDWKISVQLARARHIKDSWRAAENVLLELRKAYPSDLRVAHCFVEIFGPSAYNAPATKYAARDLIAAGEPMTPLIGDALYHGYLNTRHFEEELKNELQSMLLAHYRTETIEKARTDLANPETRYPQTRNDAYQLLVAADAISEINSVRHHLRNLFETSLSSDFGETSLVWLQEKATQDNWGKLKQELDFSVYDHEQRLFKNWHDKVADALQFIASALMPEMKAAMVNSCRESDRDRVRHNAWMVLKLSDNLDAINEAAFHKKTLTTFDCAWHTPDVFEAAIAYFKPHMQGGGSDDLRKMLVESRNYIVKWREHNKKNQHSRNKSPENYNANIALIDELLAQTGGD